MDESPYEAPVLASIRACWQIDDILPATARIAFDRPHLPEALAALDSITWMAATDKLVLNHLRGLSYMNLFAFVEEYIIGQMVTHAQAELYGDHFALRALLRFSEEEIKHQQLFKRYCTAFQRDFGRPCELLAAAAEVANVILSNSPLAVMLVTLQLEIMTQQHYTDTVKTDVGLDPLVTSILRHHWMEESQHIKIDILELDKMLAFSDEAMRQRAIDEYFGILSAFDGLLAQQVGMDIRSLEAARGRPFSDGERGDLQLQQHRSYRKDFLLMGMQNPKFVAQLARLDARADERIQEALKAFR